MQPWESAKDQESSQDSPYGAMLPQAAFMPQAMPGAYNPVGVQHQQQQQQQQQRHQQQQQHHQQGGMEKVQQPADGMDLSNAEITLQGQREPMLWLMTQFRWSFYRSKHVGCSWPM